MDIVRRKLLLVTIGTERVKQCHCNTCGGEKSGGGGGLGQGLASNPHVTNYYISLAEILLVTRIHSSQTINI